MFEKYDSSNFATLEDSIAHSKSNPFLASNFNPKLLINDYTIVEPTSTLKTFLSAYEDLFTEVTVDESYYYKPEKFSLFMYGSCDFAFLIMMINNINTVTDFNKATLKVFPENFLFKIENYLINNSNNEFTLLKPVYDY